MERYERITTLVSPEPAAATRAFITHELVIYVARDARINAAIVTVVEAHAVAAKLRFAVSPIRAILFREGVKSAAHIGSAHPGAAILTRVAIAVLAASRYLTIPADAADALRFATVGVGLACITEIRTAGLARIGSAHPGAAILTRVAIAVLAASRYLTIPADAADALRFATVGVALACFTEIRTAGVAVVRPAIIRKGTFGLEAALVFVEALDRRFKRVRGFRNVVGGTGVRVANDAHEESFPACSQAARKIVGRNGGSCFTGVLVSVTTSGGRGNSAGAGIAAGAADASGASAAVRRRAGRGHGSHGFCGHGGREDRRGRVSVRKRAEYTELF